MEFKNYKLENLVKEIFSGGTPSTKKVEYWNGNIRWMSSGETSSNFINDTNLRITELGVKESSTRLAKKNDLVMASAGQGKTRGQISYLNIDTYINQSIIAIRSDNELLDEKYLYYNLKSRYHELRSISDSASTRGSITTKMLKELNISIPKIKEQRKISKILFDLDKKIEINNKIIGNLEEQAQAIFKSWFVDFEPFQDGNFVESEIGMIPEGFEVLNLGDMYPIKSGYAFKSRDWSDKGSPIIKIKNINSGTIDFSTIDYVENKDILELASDFNVNGKEIVMALTGATTGKFGIVPVRTSAYVNQRVGLFFDKLKIGYGILFGILKQRNTIKSIVEMSQGSAQSNLSPNDVNKLKVIYCKNNKISEILNKIIEFISSVLYQNKKLEEIRDSLLPRLMSGEIDLSDLDLGGEVLEDE